MPKEISQDGLPQQPLCLEAGAERMAGHVVADDAQPIALDLSRRQVAQLAQVGRVLPDMKHQLGREAELEVREWGEGEAEELERCSRTCAYT